MPCSFLAKQCIEDPPAAPNTDKGWYDWNGNKTYTTIIKYECKNPGWGYPSNGNTTMYSECLADQTWSLTKVEKCICKLTFFPIILFILKGLCHLLYVYNIKITMVF